MYYKKHLFFCLNQRETKACCANHHAETLMNYMKDKLKALGLTGRGQFRANGAGCLDRCSEGPVLVIYPEGIWYSYKTTQDLDEIIEGHLLGGHVVERLALTNS